MICSRHFGRASGPFVFLQFFFGLLSFSFTTFTEPVYRSRIYLSKERSPPLHEKQDLFGDFERKFYSKIVFEQWKETNRSSTLKFSDISLTKVTEDTDGIAVLKRNKDRLVLSDGASQSVHFLRVKSSHPPYTYEVFKYASYVNELLTYDHALSASKSFEVTESYLSNVGQLDGTILRTLLSLNSFIADINSGAKLFTIQNPTFPIKVSPKSRSIITLGVLVGFLAGIISLVVSQRLGKEKEQAENPEQKT